MWHISLWEHRCMKAAPSPPARAWGAHLLLLFLAALIALTYFGSGIVEGVRHTDGSEICCLLPVGFPSTWCHVCTLQSWCCYFFVLLICHCLDSVTLNSKRGSFPGKASRQFEFLTSARVVYPRKPHMKLFSIANDSDHTVTPGAPLHSLDR